VGRQGQRSADWQSFTVPALSGCLGGCPPTNPDADGCRVFGTGIGYVQHIDMSALEDCANRLSTKIRLLVRPGAFIDRHRPLELIISQAGVSGDDQKLISVAFTIRNERHAESDPRCGLLILAEIADRALSPAVNDPGTAIAVIGTQIRLLNEWVDTAAEKSAILYPNLEVSPLCAEDLLDDAFSPIARDGASQFEVGTRAYTTAGAVVNNNTAPSSSNLYSFDLSAYSDDLMNVTDPVTFTVGVYSTTNGSFRLDSLQIQGDVVPEPFRALLFSMALGCCLLRRGRRRG
jgi:uncharacterized membrane protein